MAKVPWRALDATLQEMTFASTPSDIAQWLILEHGDDLLITYTDQLSGSDLHVLDPSGVWKRGDDVLQQWMVDHGNALREQAVKLTRDDHKSALGLMRQARPWFDPKVLPSVRMAAHAAYRVLRTANQGINAGTAPTFGVTLALDTELNADLRYIGCESGVIDLWRGERIAPHRAKEKLVTIAAPVKWAPPSDAPLTGAALAGDDDARDLFAHLPDAERIWWWDALGFALRGAPSARFYELQGPPRGGKNTLMLALKQTLGPYVTITQPSLLEMRRGGSNESETGLSPQVASIVPPARIAFVNEVKPQRLNHRIIKDYTGDGLITWQPKHKPPRTDPASATLIMLCNPGSQPQFGGHDEGIQRRLRALPYPAIPPDKVLPDFNTKRILDPHFKAALFARLVVAAARQIQGQPPVEPPAVAVATVERLRVDAGELGAFAARIVRGAGPLTVAAVWEAWCDHNEEPHEARSPGGIPRNHLSRRLGEIVTGLPAPKQVKANGKTVRGWHGWQLLDEAPETAPDQPDVVPVENRDGETIGIGQVQPNGAVRFVDAEGHLHGGTVGNLNGAASLDRPLDDQTIDMFPEALACRRRRSARDPGSVGPDGP